MKLLLVNAINTNKISETVFPNLGLGYLASYLERYSGGIDIMIINSNGANIRSILIDYVPDLVGISFVSQNYNFACLAADECARLKIPAFMGGIHITSLPQSLPENVFFGVIGEGEETLRQIVESFLKNNGINKENLSEIKGLVFRNSAGGLINTGERELLPLESIPFPDREKLGLRRNDFMYMFTSRGCAYRCRFCCSGKLWNKLRFFPAEYVVDEISDIVERFSPKAITFYDDDFLANKARLEQIAGLIEKKNLNRKCEFNLMSRVDMLNEDTVRLLKGMNVTVVSLGLESGSQDTLDYLKRSTVTLEENKRAVDLLERSGIITYGFFIIGSPRESSEEIHKTYQFIKSSRLSGFSVYTLVPYPGTEIWEYALERGLVSDKMDFSRLALNINESEKDVIVVSELVSKENLYKLYWKFQRLRIRKRINLMLRRALKNPGLIFPRLRRSLRHRLLKK